MEYIDLLLKIGEFVLAVIGVIGGGVGIYYWKAYKKEKEANAQSASIEAKKKEVDLVDDILHRFENFVREQMQRGEAVNKKELDRVEQNLGQQITEVQVENRKQNEALQNIVEFLDGPYAQFLAEKAAESAAINAKSKPRKK